MSLTFEQVKTKSSAKMQGLQPCVRAATELLIERCYKLKIYILVTQGLRTIPEQDALYAQGRTKPGVIVTNARGGYSYHNYGLAVDFALLLPNGSNVSWDMRQDGNNNRVADWQEVVKEAKALGFEWGGDWTNFKDYPHLQMAFGLTLTQLRAGAKPSTFAIEAAYKIINRKEEGELKGETMAVVKVNGVKVADGVLEKGVTYVPVRVIAEALGAQVGYVSATRTVEITSNH